MTAPRDWADDVAAVLYPPPHDDAAAMLRVRAERFGPEQDLRAAYLAGLEAGKREVARLRALCEEASWACDERGLVARLASAGKGEPTP